MVEKHAGVVQGRAMLQLATIYKSAAAALAQAVENSRDAKASKIWIVMEPERITVIDNGHGMIPEALPEDKAYLDMMEEVQAQNVDLSLEDIRALVSEPTRKSVEWMMRFGSFSPKRPEEDALGEKGIGHLAYLTYGGMAKLTTVPHPPLAHEFYGTSVKQEAVPQYGVELHSRESLARNITTYYEVADIAPLTDPWGKKILHGTRIEVTHLNEGIERELAPGLLASYLKDRFGPEIKEGRLTIEVVDRITKEGRATKGGKVLVVEPVKYSGHLVLSEKMYTNSLTGNIPYNIVIYLDPEGKYKSGIELRKRGLPTGNYLSDLEEFQHAPWNNGFFGGYAEFPTYPNEDRLWSTDKSVLQPSAERKSFVNKLLALEPQLNQLLEEYRKSERQNSRAALAEKIEEAAARAMQEVDSVAHLVISSAAKNGKRNRSKEKKNQVPQEPATVVVTVLDEHHRGVSDVEIQLHTLHRMVASGRTGMSGKVSLGTITQKDRTKTHIVRIVVPNGAKLMELSVPERQFRPNQLGGFKWVFHLKTGEKPKDKPIPRVRFVFTDRFSDPDEPWQQKLSVGLIEINQNARDWVQAEASGNSDVLLADYASAAIIDYGLSGFEPSYCLKQQSLLFGVMLNHAREGQSNRSRRTRR